MQWKKISPPNSVHRNQHQALLMVTSKKHIPAIDCLGGTLHLITLKTRVSMGQDPKAMEPRHLQNLVAARTV